MRINNLPKVTLGSTAQKPARNPRPVDDSLTSRLLSHLTCGQMAQWKETEIGNSHRNWLVWICVRLRSRPSEAAVQGRHGGQHLVPRRRRATTCTRFAARRAAGTTVKPSTATAARSWSTCRPVPPAPSFDQRSGVDRRCQSTVRCSRSRAGPAEDRRRHPETVAGERPPRRGTVGGQPSPASAAWTPTCSRWSTKYGVRLHW